MKLVLFDIDGTLLWTDGAGRRALQKSLLEFFGTDGASVDYWFDGKTDRQIVRELMRAEGFADLEIDARMDALLESYLTNLDAELFSPRLNARLLPGVVDVLDALSGRADALVGLLTGNLQRGADAKLRRLGIDPVQFVVGAYGSDHELRPELPAIAHGRACELLGRSISGAATVVIGDTPADIQCGRGIGARAIGVATGRYSVEELASHGPTAVFPDLADTRSVLEAILS